MAALNHPNIVQVYDFGTAEGAHFFAMEYVHGAGPGPDPEGGDAGRPRPAARAGHRRDRRGGGRAALRPPEDRPGRGAPADRPPRHLPLQPAGVLRRGRQADRLRHRQVGQAPDRDPLRHLKGKIAYMSPEQCRAGPLDRRSDVFGLGILLYELTTGTRLFQGISDFAVLEQIVHQDVPRPSSRRAGYPTEIEQIVMKALARDPDDRHASARDLQLELEQYALENKLMISAVARAAEMEALFGNKVEAWREAAQAGRSLGEHLAAEKTRTRPELRETYVMSGAAIVPSGARRRCWRRRAGGGGRGGVPAGAAAPGAPPPAPAAPPAPVAPPARRGRAAGRSRRWSSASVGNQMRRSGGRAAVAKPARARPCPRRRRSGPAGPRRPPPRRRPRRCGTPIRSTFPEMARGTRCAPRLLDPARGRARRGAGARPGSGCQPGRGPTSTGGRR